MPTYMESQVVLAYRYFLPQKHQTGTAYVCIYTCVSLDPCTPLFGFKVGPSEYRRGGGGEIRNGGI